MRNQADSVALAPLDAAMKSPDEKYSLTARRIVSEEAGMCIVRGGGRVGTETERRRRLAAFVGSTPSTMVGLAGKDRSERFRGASDRAAALRQIGGWLPDRRVCDHAGVALYRQPHHIAFAGLDIKVLSVRAEA